MKKIKLDENFSHTLVDIFSKHKIDASSVYHQQMQGSEDESIFDACINEDRILITFDLDFANIIRYPSIGTPGIIIVRTKKKMSLSVIKTLCQRLAQIVAAHEVKDKLFIVEETKIRIRKPDK